MLLRAIFLGLALSSPALANDLDWLSGHWRSEENGRISEEIWTTGEGGLYLGVNRTVREGQARGFEFLRIHQTENGYTYCAQPGGNSATCFDSVDIDHHQVVFENEEHDFPQRITYGREGDVLTASISDISGEQSFSFEWRRVED